MNKFKYSAIKKNGEIINGIEKALNKDELSKILLKKNLYLEKSTKVKSNKNKKITNAKLAQFSEILSIYLESKITINQSLLLMNTQYNKEMLLFVESLSNQINEGDTFSNALQNQTIYEIPNFYIETIKVSESRGQLDKALIELSSYLKKSVTTEEKIKSALTYPVFLITISISIIIFMMTYIVPEISNMFQENNQKLPNITEIVLNTSNFISTNIFYIVFIIITIIITYKILIKNKKIKLIKDKFLLKVPLVKRLIISSELSKFSYIAILLSKSGLTFIDVIQLSSKTITNDFLRNILIEASKNIEEGQKLSFVLKKQKKFIFDEQFTQAILLGEETSKIEISLKNIKNLYELEYDNKINKFLSLLEPTMMLIVGGVIGTIVIAMLLPIFSMDVLS